MIKNIKWLFLVCITLAACNNDDVSFNTPVATADVAVTKGDAIFTNYVALGDSFAAGHSDNALFIEGQKGAYPNILAQQFVAAGGGNFNTPFMSDNIGGFTVGGTLKGTPRLYLSYASGSPAPAAVTGTPTTEATTKLTGTFNNLGVPGAKSYHLLASGYGSAAGLSLGTANPYYVRFATSSSASLVADAVAQPLTFFSLFIGGNDVLGYATSGGTGTNRTGDTNYAGYGSSDITDPGVFESVYNTIINTLTGVSAKGVVANLPYVSTLPFFTTVKYNALTTITEDSATKLNAAYKSYNSGLQSAKDAGLITEAERLKRTINFVTGTNALVIVDEYLKPDLSGSGLPNYRQATAADYILLSSGGVSTQTQIASGGGTQTALADAWVLSAGEVAEIQKATDLYNTIIESIATAKGLAFFDAKAMMYQLSTVGVSSNNVKLTSAFASGGAFSLDGVHPSPRGYALIANGFIKAINAKYKSTIKEVDLSTYRTLFPSSL